MGKMNPIENFRSWGQYVTSPYGPRTGQYAGYHRGTDIGGIPCGAPVRTPLPGKVVAVFEKGRHEPRPSDMWPSWGNIVCVELADGKIQLSAHKGTVTVKVGDVVKKKDQIGTNGGTHYNHPGNFYACHIHYEILNSNGTQPWNGSVWGDPEKYWLKVEIPAPSDRFEEGQYIKNKTEYNVRIRKEPGTSSEIIGSIEPDQLVKIQKHADNGIWATGYHWWRSSGGWIAEDFFKIVVPEDPDPVEPPEIIDPGGDEGFIEEPVPDTPEEKPETPKDTTELEDHREFLFRLLVAIKKIVAMITNFLTKGGD